MDRALVPGILLAALLAVLGLALLMPDPTPPGGARLPWQVDLTTDGTTRVFGLTLGASTLAEARALFGESGELNLFRAGDAQAPRLSVEAYFSRLHLHRLRADFVLTLEIATEQLAAAYARGLRISQLPSGDKKVRLAPEDEAAFATAPIRAITYLPQARLDPALIERRFGQPAQQLVEPESGVVHHLYPEHGIDVALAADGETVIQYVAPAAFETLLAPLEAHATDQRTPST
ncbi:hypothetical protein [Marichromatium bheemlicum]|uniref:Uncharacterized protein n=1 Tax=Marichromatium bheemlicum TaxID=365339 RepID=A0ABX1I4Y0_9GAMM|nr:hypothetical protein [Marichromatium bheemlicum]NKN31969.1 hypothetical protein [Marichromatium bheemlicum]